MSTDTSEAGLERLICIALAGHPCEPPSPDAVGEPAASYGGVGWIGGSYLDYNREYCVDLVQLTAFAQATQPEVADALALDEDGPIRRRFLARLQGEITKRGIVDVLRKGIAHGAHQVDLFYGAPSPGNEQARERFEQNRFTVTRQLRYSRDETQRALDIALFINGLPVITFELKNKPHQADRGRRGRAIQAGPKPAREAVRTRAVHRAFRRGRVRSALLHPARRQGVVVPAVQPGLEQRRGQSAEPERTEGRLPVARGADAPEPDRRDRELRPIGGESRR